MIEKKGKDFRKGQEVEITSEEEGFEDSWFVANIVGKSFSRNKYKVKYQSLLNDDETQPLTDYVEIYNIRPIPPKETLGATRSFEIDQQVDAFLNDGWWKGVINGVIDEGSRYSVFFPPTKEILEFDQFDLRAHLDWINGKWVSQNQVLFEETAVNADNCESFLATNHTGSSVCSIDMDISQTPRAVRKNLWDEGVARSKYMQGRKDQSITESIDSPNDGLVSSQKYMKHSVQKSDAEVERPSKKLKCGEATCNSKRTSVKSHFDAPYGLSFSNTKGKEKNFNNKSAVNPISSESSPQLHSDFIEAELSEVVGVVNQTNVLEKERVKPSGSGKKQKSVGAAGNQTTNPTRKRGRPPGSGKKHEREIIKPLALGMAFPPLGTENGFSSNEVTDDQTEWPSDIAEEHQPLSIFLAKSSSHVVKDIEGMMDKQIVNVLKGKSEQIIKGSSKKASVIGLEHEAASGELSVLKECSQLTITAEECQPLSPCSEKSNSHALNGNGGALPDDQYIQNKTMNQIEVSVEVVVLPHSSNVAESCSLLHTTFEDESHHNNLSGDERELHLGDITANTCSSPKQQDEGLFSLPDGKLPFVKHPDLWQSCESLEVFQRMPQKPHFLPLEQYDEEIREGYAIANMLNLANLVQKTLEAKLDEPTSVYESRLKRLTDLEEHGFTVQPIRVVLEGLLKIKASYSELDDKTTDAEKEFVEEKGKLDEVEESIKQLNIKLQTLKKDREMRSSTLADCQRKLAEVQECIHGVKLDFEKMVASLTRSE
ncbi:hypothetical protein FRX31_015747 [Thalictrum thalictroides]|uniref:Agenet domain-containing protein n=1 Tax=Thalictrum thalictroides TaxID=46969 RepID=A0A7J6WB51_THATH|nr:hypothetical protein FRX31_015747 [Thalictrum thalictroides]